MSLSITDLFAVNTAAQWRTFMVDELEALEIPASQWRPGGVFSTMLTVISIVLFMLSTIISDLIKDFFLPTATGDGLKLLALYAYGVTVPEATFATGVVTLTNTGGGVYTKQIGEYVALNPVSGITYTNTAVISLGALQTLTGVPMRATTQGSAGNSTPNTITANSTTMLGVTVNNPAAFVGVDAPTDPAIRQLCINALAAGSVRGVRNVYAYAIQTAVNDITGDPVNINRWAISESSHFGTVDLLVAAPSGVPDPDDLVGIRTRIEEIARPMGVSVTTSGATEVSYAPTVSIWATAPTGTSADDVKESVDAAILVFIAAYPIGGATAADDESLSFTGLFGEGLTGAIGKGCADIGATLLSVRGATDLALAYDEVADNEVVTSVNLVAPSAGVLV